MPNRSYGFATGAVRVLESRMITTERIERLITAANEMDAIKVLQEAGYGRGEDIAGVADYEKWLDTKSQEIYAFIRSVTPDSAATDCFLLRIDYTNLKALYKARCLMQEPEGVLREGGVYSLAIEIAAVQEQDYARLPLPMQQAFTLLDAQLASSAVSPQTIDTVLDKAYFKDIHHRLLDTKSKVIAQYFVDLSDLSNLRSVLRAKALGLGREDLRMQLVEGGIVSQSIMEMGLDEPERVLVALRGRSFKRDLDEVMLSYQQSGALAQFELFLDNHLLGLIKARQWSSGSVEPLIGYFLGMEREISAIRLCMVGQINGFAVDAMRERLGDLYV